MPATPGKLWVGTAGWWYDDWKGRVYPDPAPRGFQPLEFLSRFFNCVEVNLSYYRTPDLKLVEGWLRQVRARPEFAFVSKLHQNFTHGSDPWGHADAQGFLAPFAPLRAAGKLAALLVQLPWSARFENPTRDRLARIADEFASVPLVLEVRHASWDRPEAREWIRARAYHYCNIDQPALRDCLPPSDHATGAIGYVRLHGRNREAWFDENAGRDRRYDYYYRDAELAEWVPRVQRLLFDLPNVYVIGNNHYRGQAAANALQLRAKVTGEQAPVPPDLVRAYPELAGISRPDPEAPPVQRTLFD